MKKLSLVFSVLVAIFSVSCVHVTKDMKEVFGHVEENIQYHNKKYMKAKPIYVPHGVDEKKLGTLKFNFGFEQGNVGNGKTSVDYDANHLDNNEWRAFKREFENAIAGIKRFPLGQLKAGLADNELRRDANNGLNRTKDLDYSAMSEVDGILHIIPLFTMNSPRTGINFFRGGGYLRTTTSTLKVTCNPLSAVNNEPIDEFQSFSVQTVGVIQRKEDKYGNPRGGLVFDESTLTDLHIMQTRATIVMFFNKIYNLFPVGGPVVNFDEDGNAVIRASRATGVQPNMQFVIYAMKKADGDSAVRVPLFNATAVSVGQTGTSTLETWRKNNTKAAKAIIKKISTDFNAAKQEYNFYGCSDGLAEWPDFIQRAFDDED